MREGRKGEGKGGGISPSRSFLKVGAYAHKHPQFLESAARELTTGRKRPQ